MKITLTYEFHIPDEGQRIPKEILGKSDEIREELARIKDLEILRSSIRRDQE